MRIEGPWTDSAPATFICDRLLGCGHRALFVGGAVRNTVLGIPVGDLDIATDARPEKVLAVFDRTDAKLCVQGIQFGTIMIVREGTSIAVTSFRRDIETDGRYARVAFTDRIEEDAARRDFTMNAIYAEFDGMLIDPLGGLDDLLKRRVRFVGNPRDRILEDRLRMLRLFRFHAHFGDPAAGIDPDGLEAVTEFADGIEIISAERTTIELLNILSAPLPGRSVSSMAETGLLERILPGASPDVLLRIEHLERIFEVGPDPLRRLAAIGGNTDLMTLDRRSAARLRRLLSGIDLHLSAEELGYRFGEQEGLDVAILCAARADAAPPADLRERIREGSAQEFPVRAWHLPDYLEGQAIGSTLRMLERCWIASGFNMTVNELISSLDTGSVGEAAVQ